MMEKSSNSEMEEVWPAMPENGQILVQVQRALMDMKEVRIIHLLTLMTLMVLALMNMIGLHTIHLPTILKSMILIY